MLSRVNIISCRHGVQLARRLSSSAFNSPFNFVDGGRVDTTSGQSFANYNPSTGELLCEVGVSSKDDVSRAVKTAKSSLDMWANTDGLERGRVLRKAARIIRDRKEELARVETTDIGRTIWESRVDMDANADTLEYAASLASILAGEHVMYGSGSFAYTRREPVGVVGAIGAWNYPLQMAVFKSGPALACGNTVVFKPSENSPVSALLLGEIFKEAGLPDGCFNVVQGAGDVGAALSEHPDVAKMTFTGSVETGSRVMQACAKDIKRVTLELGGKSPLIIFEDADIENAIKGTMMANYLNQGQVCSNGTRVFVQKKILGEFVERLRARVEALKIGDPMSDDVQIGPIINGTQAGKILGYLCTATLQGATLLTGGQEVKPADSKLSGGHYISPCIITNCNDDMAFVKEEIFGPVAAVLPFDSEEEVIRRANDTTYGLAAGVFTRDISRAHRVAAKFQAGAVYINTFNIFLPEIPFGGYKKSGIGRENSQATINYFTELKSVYVEVGAVDYPF